MLEQLGLHTLVHLRFLARSRVLAAFAIIIGLWSAISFVPALVYESVSSRFDLLKSMAIQLHGTAGLITAGIGLFVLWSHRRQRSIKMIATKPTPFEGWVASIFLAAIAAGLAAHAAVIVVTFVGSMYWGIPYELGFVFLAATYLATSMIRLAFLTALSAALHPVIATLIMLFFSEQTLQFLGTMTAAAGQAGRSSLLSGGATYLLRALYYVVPAYAPFSDETARVQLSLRVSMVDWKYLAAAYGYALLACAFGYLMTLAVLRRRSLV